MTDSARQLRLQSVGLLNRAKWAEGLLSLASDFPGKNFCSTQSQTSSPLARKLLFVEVPRKMMALLPKKMSGWVYYHCGGGHTALKVIAYFSRTDEYDDRLPST